jgi:hypothetical protein
MKKGKNSLTYLKKILVPRSLKTTRKNRTSPNNATNKKRFSQKLNISKTNNEKVQISNRS